MTANPHGYRLPTGGTIDRTRTICFTFNGRRFRGHPGDTLASALLANGVDLIGRSFKYRRPRGFHGVALEDPGSMLAVSDAYGFDPALRAGQVGLCEGLDARSITGWPTPAFDVGAVAQLFSGILAAGFYYKTFMWPGWRWFEPWVRRATGFGRARQGEELRQTQHRYENCDVLVIGAGPAGLLVGRALRDTGLRVVVADENDAPGGSLLWENVELEGNTGLSLARSLGAELASVDNFALMTRTLVAGAYENNTFTLVRRSSDERGVCAETLVVLRTRYVVLASGMVDRPLLFEGNDRPGVMLSSAVRRLIGEFAVAPARQLAVYTNNDSAYLTAIDARRAGVDVVALIDTRPASAAIHAGELERLGIACYFETQIEKAAGYRRVNQLTLRVPDGSIHRVRCDGLASSGGWTPLIHLAAHRGVRPEYDSRRSMFVCRQLPHGWCAVGGANGALDMQTLVDEAERAAQWIATAEGRQFSPIGVGHINARSFGTVQPLWTPPYSAPTKTWVDLQNDVKVADIQLAVQENYVSVEHLKRYTTLGMGTDQGRTSNVNGLAVLAELTRRPIETVGTTTFRPPYAGLRMATIANGRRSNLYRPRRYLPADAFHRERDAVMEDFGWERPDWYRTDGADRESAVAAEVRAVREHVGVFDSSSLGKIEITGPDAREFITKFYVSNMVTLSPGRIRYSVMLRDNGVIFDDGVVTCVSENHFIASPTSSNADFVATWFERWRQTEWPGARVAVSPVTSSWASVALAGPKARDLLQRLQPSFDISGAAFPHMAYREGSLCGVHARVFRVSFTGELQYEVAVAARYATGLLRLLLQPEGGIRPRAVGMEAWLRLRLEKGYLHVGTDTNGRTTPLDVGMSAIVAKRADDFIGKRSLRLPFATSTECEQLVGLCSIDGRPLVVGSRILVAGHSKVPCPTDGYVTSACESAVCGGFVGLALLERGQQRKGETVLVYDSGNLTRCEVRDPVFLDPANERLHG